MRSEKWQRLGAAFAVAAGLAACGGGSTTTAGTTTAGGEKDHVSPYVDVYAGLPLRGPMAGEGQAVLSGIKLARNNIHAHPGDLAIRFHWLDDSGRKTGDGNLALTAKHAGTVATDPHAVYYIGDLGSAEAEVSAPMLSAAGIAQVTPGDPYISQVPSPSGAAAPASTLLRLLPSYTVQAAADVLSFKQIPPMLKDDACTRVMAVAEGDPESVALVNLMYQDAKADGITMPKPTKLTSKATSLTNFQTSLEHLSPSLAPCGFVIAGSQTKPAVALTKMIHSIFTTHAFIVGTSGICNSKWTKAADGGVPATIDPWLWCTSPLLPVDQYNGSDGFVDLYKSAHHGSYPSQYAFYGYEAAELGIQMIDSLGASAANRNMVRDSLFDSQLRDSIFLPYGSLANRDPTLTTYGVYRVDPATAEPTRLTIVRP